MAYGGWLEEGYFFQYYTKIRKGGIKVLLSGYKKLLYKNSDDAPPACWDQGRQKLAEIATQET